MVDLNQIPKTVEKHGKPLQNLASSSPSHIPAHAGPSSVGKLYK